MRRLGRGKEEGQSPSRLGKEKLWERGSRKGRRVRKGLLLVQRGGGRVGERENRGGARAKGSRWRRTLGALNCRGYAV